MTKNTSKTVNHSLLIDTTLRSQFHNFSFTIQFYFCFFENGNPTLCSCTQKKSQIITGASLLSFEKLVLVDKLQCNTLCVMY